MLFCDWIIWQMTRIQDFHWPYNRDAPRATCSAKCGETKHSISFRATWNPYDYAPADHKPFASLASLLTRSGKEKPSAFYRITTMSSSRASAGTSPRTATMTSTTPARAASNNSQATPIAGGHRLPQPTPSTQQHDDTAPALVESEIYHARVSIASPEAAGSAPPEAPQRSHLQHRRVVFGCFFLALLFLSFLFAFFPATSLVCWCV